MVSSISGLKSHQQGTYDCGALTPPPDCELGRGSRRLYTINNVPINLLFVLTCSILTCASHTTVHAGKCFLVEVNDLDTVFSSWNGHCCLLSLHNFLWCSSYVCSGQSGNPGNLPIARGNLHVLRFPLAVSATSVFNLDWGSSGLCAIITARRQ